jgi:hypothetical protein
VVIRGSVFQRVFSVQTLASIRARFPQPTKRYLVMSAKKEYGTPSVTVHGSVEEITRQGGFDNKDDPEGPANTAYS